MLELNLGDESGCSWPSKDPELLHYHDNEWGIPVHDDRLLFEFLILDGFQAGLSWTTILHKRENFRKAFDNFDAAPIASYNDKKIAALMADPGIIRNKLKIHAAISNARAYLEIMEKEDGFSAYIWSFVNGKPIHNRWNELKQVPATSKESDAMSKALRKDGFSFVGSTICYAFMQAAGLVNDHLVTCHRYEIIKNEVVSKGLKT